VNLLDVKIDPFGMLSNQWKANLLGGVMIVEGTGYQMERAWPKNGLYRPLVLGKESQASDRKVTLTAIPYFAWGNRGLKSMRVWIPYTNVS